MGDYPAKMRFFSHNQYDNVFIILHLPFYVGPLLQSK